MAEMRIDITAHRQGWPALSSMKKEVEVEDVKSS